MGITPESVHVGVRIGCALGVCPWLCRFELCPSPGCIPALALDRLGCGWPSAGPALPGFGGFRPRGLRPADAGNQHPPRTERARRRRRSCEIPGFTSSPDLLRAVKYDQQSSACREQIGHREKKSKLERGSGIFNKSGFFFRLGVRGVLPALRGAGFCSGPRTALKVELLKLLKGFT